MRTSPKHGVVVFAVISGLLLCATTGARAHDTGDFNAELKKALSELRGEMAAVKAELQSVRQQLQRLESGGVQASPGDQEGPTLADIDQQLKLVLRELAAVKKGQASPPKKKRPPDTTVYDVEIGASPILGPPDAPVTIVEFVDFQCPWCAREYPKIQQIRKDYPDKVRVVFKHFPLNFHPKAKPVHAASVLAAKKGNDAFWQMHDKIMANPKKLEVDVMRGYAEELGVDLVEFDAVMADPARIDQLIAPDLAVAKKTNVRGTPTVLINGLKLSSRDLEDYRTRVDAILKGKNK